MSSQKVGIFCERTEGRNLLCSTSHSQGRWSYTLRGFNQKNNKEIYYQVSDDKDKVQDQLVGRAERGYWRPLTKPLPPLQGRHKENDLLLVEAAGIGGGDTEIEDNEDVSNADALANTPRLTLALHANPSPTRDDSP